VTVSPRVLLLSAYDAHSHRHWRRQLTHQFPAHQWQVLTLTDRHFAWRMGGNALSFKAHYDRLLAGEFDLLLATSMTDLSTLRGFYPHLGQIPNALYFHENQFAYPVNHRQQGLQEIQMRSLNAAMAADRLIFNSVFNRNTFVQGVSHLCQKMPDGIPANLITQLSAKSAVLPVPLATDCQSGNQPAANDQGTIEVVWNHRWEHDKGPETLLALLRLCQQQPPGQPVIRFHILGQQFRQQPAAFDAITQNHAEQCLHLGHVASRTDYLAILRRADVVLSTAFHDFQGLAMLEAVACGCRPLAPERLVYPELYPASHLYPSNPADPEQEAAAIWSRLSQVADLPVPKIRCHWSDLHDHYAQLLNPDAWH
jgi:glycosyltransferase involved in cell wall biosynthesis